MARRIPNSLSAVLTWLFRSPSWVPYCMIGQFNVDFTQGAEVNGTSVADVGWAVSDVIARWTLHRQRSGEEGVAV